MCDRFSGGGVFLPPSPYPWVAPKMPILNRVKSVFLFQEFWVNCSRWYIKWDFWLFCSDHQRAWIVHQTGWNQSPSICTIFHFHPRFLTYKRVYGKMHGARKHTSLKLLLKAGNKIKWKKVISTWWKNMYVLLIIQIIAFIKTTLTDCGSFCLLSRVEVNWQKPPLSAKINFKFLYVQEILVVQWPFLKMQGRWLGQSERQLAVWIWAQTNILIKSILYLRN